MQARGLADPAGPDAVAIRSLLRDLSQAVADLAGPPTGRERLCSLLRIGCLFCLLVAGIAVDAALPFPWAVLPLPVCGVAYALLLIATHEMLHGTLFGWGRLEYALACLLSWPMAWPFATYARLHHLHHRWNGLDSRDPERTDPHPLPPRWAPIASHPLPIRCLLLEIGRAHV